MKSKFELIKIKWKIGEIDKESREFPKDLLTIRKCPLKIYFRGVWDIEIFKKTAAIVGSRKISKYGVEVCEKLTAKLVGKNYSIVSGFMYGTDSVAHRKCIYNGGRTIAVLGGGLDRLYPPENLDLYEEILENNGLILSEYEKDFVPTLWTFPQRNRIVAGLSNKGVYVIEASLKSGSLITARIAFEEKRKVYAVPGQITSPLSQGTNWLIEQGRAKILIDLESDEETVQEKLDLFDDLSKEEKELIEVLKIEPKTIDELAKYLDDPISLITVKLSKLGLKGMVTEDGGLFCLRR